jgi:hypothetical protein
VNVIGDGGFESVRRSWNGKSWIFVKKARPEDVGGGQVSLGSGMSIVKILRNR